MSTTDVLGQVTEPAKEVPVLYDVDVVVAGSGTASTIAAIAAGRFGAKTLVVDRFGQVGGNIGPGMWCGGSLHLALAGSDPDDEALINRQGMGGIAEEFHHRVIFGRPNAGQMSDETRRALEEKHLNVDGYRAGAGGDLPGYLADSHVCSHVALAMMDEAGVELLLSAYAADPLMEGNTVKGLFVETKSGRVAARAKVVIDGTGQAEVAQRAGAPVKKVTGPNQGLYYVLGRVDWDRYQRFAQEHAGDATEDDLEWSRTHLAASATEADPFPALHHLLPHLRAAWEKGEFEFRRQLGAGSIHISLKRVDEGMAGGRTGTAGEVDVSEAKVVSLMEREHREQCYKFARFLRQYIPGFEESYLMLCSPFLGARGGRHIDAEYPISREDLTAQRRFDDVIYIFDDERTAKSCDVPYRALLPRDVDGLIATGRSAMPYGPNFRMRSNMLLNGQAAGVAAALCVRDGVQPRDLEVRELQKVLVHELGGPVAEKARLEALGLLQ